MKRFTFTVGAALVAASIAGSAMAKETIVIGDVSWEASHAISNVLKFIIETKLDADVKIIPADQAAIFASMDKGDGSIDVLPDLWMPNQKDRWAKFIAPGSKESVLVNDKPYTGGEGVYIPGYIQDKYGIKKIEQLTDPKVAKLFDIDNSGKGSYWAGAPGWNVTNVELARAKGYGYDKTFKPFVVSDSAMRAELTRAFATQKAFVFYFWEPEGLFKKFDVRKLEEPAYNESCYKPVAPTEGADWLEKSKVTCASPSTTIYVAYSKSLTKRAPKVAQFLKQVKFENATLNEWILRVTDKENPAELAKKWVEANPKMVNAWLAGVK